MPYIIYAVVLSALAYSAANAAAMNLAVRAIGI